MKLERDLPLTVFKPHVQTYAIVERGSDEYKLTGHGFVSIINDEVQNQTVHFLQVENNVIPGPVLRSKLRLHNNYEKQRGSVIVWNDPEQTAFADLGMSFESVQECDMVWRLICQKIGKNYLEINGWDKLPLPNQHNLTYILDKTKTSRDLVEYNLLHAPTFSNALFDVFRKFEGRNDGQGMNLVGKIIRSIFSNPDYRMIEALFKDPTFDLVLYVQKYLQKIDFPTCWAQKLTIRTIIPLDDELSNKIKLVHRLNFYRESILDLMKETNLEQMLVMTQLEFSKQIISTLTKDSILDHLVASTYQHTHDHFLLPNLNHKPSTYQLTHDHLLLPNLNHEIAEEDTRPSEAQAIRLLQFAQKKVDFLLEALIISKQIQDENAKLRLLEKIYKCGVVEMAAEYLDRGINRAVDFVVLLAKSSPPKFMEYLKTRYQESPSNNLYIKLCRKYNLGNQLIQNCILQLIKYLAQTFKAKQNLLFFTETFFKLILAGCKDLKAVLALLSQLQGCLVNIESLFGLAVSNKVFYKLGRFLQKQKKDKVTDLRAIKVLRRALYQNADSGWQPKKQFLDRLNLQMVKSQFFQYCMQVLYRNMPLNNVISSSMLANLKKLSQITRFTQFHEAIRKKHDPMLNSLSFFSKILEVQPELAYNNEIQSQVGQDLSNHQKELNQQFLSYLTVRMSQDEQPMQPNKRSRMGVPEQESRMEMPEQEKQQQMNQGNIGSQPYKKIKQSIIDPQPSSLLSQAGEEIPTDK